MQNFSVYVHMEQVVTICCGFNVWTWPWFQVANCCRFNVRFWCGFNVWTWHWFQVANCCGVNVRFWWGFNVWIGRWFYVEIPRWFNFHFQLQINKYPTSTSDVDSTWIPLQILMWIQRLNRTLIPRWNPTLIQFSFSTTNQQIPNVNIRRGFHVESTSDSDVDSTSESVLRGCTCDGPQETTATSGTC